MLQIVFFAQKTPDFGKKNTLRIWGVPPPPLYGQNFQQKGGYGFGGYTPSPLRTKFSAERGLRIWGVHPLPFTDKIRKVVVVVAIFYLSDMGEDCNILSHFINIGVHS